MSRESHEVRHVHAQKRRKLSHDPATKPDTRLPNGNSNLTSEDVDDMTNGVQCKLNGPINRHSDGRDGRMALPASKAGSTLTSQAQGLISNLTPDYHGLLKDTRPRVDTVIQVIKSMPAHGPFSLSDVQAFSQKSLKVTVPWVPRPKSDTQYKFSFVPPTKVNISGTLALGIGTMQDSSTIISPEMPEDMFQEKDYLNHRALHKRAFYLACITSKLRKELSDDFKMEFSASEGNPSRPVLVLRSKTDATEIIVSPSVPFGIGPINKTTPAHANIRKDASTKAIDSSSPSSLYNSTIRALASVKQYDQLIERGAAKADHFRDACILGSRWLQQRGFGSDQSDGGLGIYEWATICALLLESGGHQGHPLFSPRYSALQLWKAMMQVLGNRDMFDPYVVRGNVSIAAAGIPILYDATTGVNLLYKMQPWSYIRLKTLAAQSLATSNNKTAAAFGNIFVKHVADGALAYDEVYELDLADPDVDPDTAQIYNTFKTALSDRITLLDIRQGSLKPWKITSSPSPVRNEKLILSINVRAETSSRLIDHGPSIEEKSEVEQFQQFWGNKSELRKFKDGRISETLVWSADTPVIRQIIDFVCKRHLKLEADKIHSSPSLLTRQLQKRANASNAFAAVNSKFQTLSSVLHHLDGLPLPVRSVAASSEQLRSASIDPPLAETVQPINVTIQFDTSGRWPDHLSAIQYTKIAFLTKVGDLIVAQDKTWEARVGLENTSSSSTGTQNTSFLDIIQTSQSPTMAPLVFRLRIYHERELHLIETALSSKTLDAIDRELFQRSLQAQKQITASISHTNTFRTLITAFPPLSDTIRLLKLFVAAHHLTNHFPPEVLETIAAKVFVDSEPWPAPGSANTAFLRCLRFLADWNWSTEPLVVDLSLGQDMTLEQKSELQSRYMAWRQMDPNMNTVAWFVGTNIDQTGVVWTQGAGGLPSHPPRVVASRLTTLAKAAMDLVKTQIAHSPVLTADTLDSIFASSLVDFDFVLHLHSTKRKSKSGFKNLDLASSLDFDTTGIDTVSEYVRDLTRSFGSVAVFFYGGIGSKVICGLWRPHVRGEDKPWKIRLGYSTIPLPAEESEQAACKVNFSGMLAEMGMMGEGILDRIAVKEQGM